jgi:hypothetical protein
VQVAASVDNCANAPAGCLQDDDTTAVVLATVTNDLNIDEATTTSLMNLVGLQVRPGTY